MEEEWRDIPGYEGWYQVSTLGRVRRIKSGRRTTPGKIIKPLCDTRSDHLPYARVYLYKGDGASRKRIMVHKLVAAAFIGPCPDEHDVNHKDGDPTNNRPDNLEYVTRKGNLDHARYVLKSFPPRHGDLCPAAKLTEGQVRELRRLYATGQYYQRELGEMFGLAQSSVSLIITGTNWSHLE